MGGRKEKEILFNCIKALLKVGDDIVNMLCADRETNGVRLNSAGEKLIFGEL